MLFLACFLEHLQKGFLSIFFVCFIFNVSLRSAPKRRKFDIQRNTRVGSGGQFTSNRLSCHHTCMYTCMFTCIFIQLCMHTCIHYLEHQILHDRRPKTNFSTLIKNLRLKTTRPTRQTILSHLAFRKFKDFHFYLSKKLGRSMSLT